jgi:uncharacterized membrane protein YtjA (UPF0391 family)
MLRLLVIFVTVAVIAAIFGYAGFATGFEEHARIVFFLATLASVVVMVFGGNPFKK